MSTQPLSTTLTNVNTKDIDTAQPLPTPSVNINTKNLRDLIGDQQVRPSHDHQDEDGAKVRLTKALVPWSTMVESG